MQSHQLSRVGMYPPTISNQSQAWINAKRGAGKRCVLCDFFVIKNLKEAWNLNTDNSNVQKTKKYMGLFCVTFVIKYGTFFYIPKVKGHKTVQCLRSCLQILMFCLELTANPSTRTEKTQYEQWASQIPEFLRII